MQEKEKLPPTAWLSTLLIGIYTLFLAIVEARIAIFLFYAKNITTAGAHIISESETMSDYIGGHLVLSGVFTTMLGGLTGVDWSNCISSGSRDFYFILSLPGYPG